MGSTMSGVLGSVLCGCGLSSSATVLGHLGPPHLSLCGGSSVGGSAAVVPLLCMCAFTFLLSSAVCALRPKGREGLQLHGPSPTLTSGVWEQHSSRHGRTKAREELCRRRRAEAAVGLALGSVCKWWPCLAASLAGPGRLIRGSSTPPGSFLSD